MARTCPLATVMGPVGVPAGTNHQRLLKFEFRLELRAVFWRPNVPAPVQARVLNDPKCTNARRIWEPEEDNQLREWLRPEERYDDDAGLKRTEMALRSACILSESSRDKKKDLTRMDG